MKSERSWGRLGLKYNIWKDCRRVPLPELLDFIVDNRGKTVPTVNQNEACNVVLIATNCIRNENLYPVYEKIRFISEDTYKTWFRSHPIPGDIIFVNKGTPGRVCLCPDIIDFCIAQDMMAFRADSNKLYNKYLLAVLRSRMMQEQIRITSVGDTIPHFKKEFLKDLYIPVPPMEIQRIIGDYYYNLSQKIELNKKINENLEQQAQVIFKSWFVDFEPFGGAMPDDWRIGMLSEIAEISSGKRPPMRQADKTDNVYIPLVGAASVMGYTNESNHRDKILVIGRVGTHGIVQRFNVPCWTSDNTLVITSPYYEYTYQVLKQIDYTAMNRGSTQPLITQGDMNKAEILLPDEELILKYERLVGILFAQHEHNQSENVYLANLRDTLLPKLMNGEIDVSQVQI